MNNEKIKKDLEALTDTLNNFNRNTGEDIIKLLKSNDIDTKTFYYMDFDKDDREFLKDNNLNDVEEIDESNSYQVTSKVFYFKKHDVYIKIDGYESSYGDETTFDDWSYAKIVRPKQVIVTEYTTE